jgi:hypothetical protein
MVAAFHKRPSFVVFPVSLFDDFASPAGDERLRTMLLSCDYVNRRQTNLVYNGLHLNEERRKVGRNKRSVSGKDDRAGNGLQPYPGLRKVEGEIFLFPPLTREWLCICDAPLGMKRL